MQYNSTSNNMIEKHKNKGCKRASFSKIEKDTGAEERGGDEEEEEEDEEEEEEECIQEREKVKTDSGFVLILSDMF